MGKKGRKARNRVGSAGSAGNAFADGADGGASGGTAGDATSQRQAGEGTSKGTAKGKSSATGKDGAEGAQATHKQLCPRNSERAHTVFKEMDEKDKAELVTVTEPEVRKVMRESLDKVGDAVWDLLAENGVSEGKESVRKVVDKEVAQLRKKMAAEHDKALRNAEATVKRAQADFMAALTYNDGAIPLREDPVWAAVVTILEQRLELIVAMRDMHFHVALLVGYIIWNSRLPWWITIAIAYFLLSDHSSQLRAKFVTLVDDALAGPDSTANTIEWKMQGYASAAVVLMQADRDDWFMYHVYLVAAPIVFYVILRAARLETARTSGAKVLRGLRVVSVYVSYLVVIYNAWPSLWSLLFVAMVLLPSITTALVVLVVAGVSIGAAKALQVPVIANLVSAVVVVAAKGGKSWPVVAAALSVLAITLWGTWEWEGFFASVLRVVVCASMYFASPQVLRNIATNLALLALGLVLLVLSKVVAVVQAGTAWFRAQTGASSKGGGAATGGASGGSGTTDGSGGAGGDRTFGYDAGAAERGAGAPSQPSATAGAGVADGGETSTSSGAHVGAAAAAAAAAASEAIHDVD